MRGGSANARNTGQRPASAASSSVTAGLYTPDERARRDGTVWTLVQGILAPVQFLVFLISLGLVLAYMATGEGYWAATVSIVVKTLVLYAIMITGSIWEKVVFGQYLFARPFFWEDVFSMLVLALHTGYLAALASGLVAPETLMWIALAAYATYVINAGQFVWKLRLARLQGAQSGTPRGPSMTPAARLPAGAGAAS
ncbi:MAG: 2-vinyl bacteriochlorophyllide hydratase [Hyphomicrobiaceae bacterium]|nr:2-vinyl bacteriochlorophyllide hydratase [Hyphomicrobiaceae bacterium]